MLENSFPLPAKWNNPEFSGGGKDLLPGRDSGSMIHPWEVVIRLASGGVVTLLFDDYDAAGSTQSMMFVSEEVSNTNGPACGGSTPAL